MTSALDMPEIMSYIYSKSWKLQFSASSSIIIIEDYYLQTFLHSLDMDNNKIQKIFHYIIVLWLVILWAIMMFCPEHIDTMNFKIFFSISLACSMIYSFCREKYFPMQTVSKTEKYVSIILIILLFLRFLFLKN